MGEAIDYALPGRRRRKRWWVIWVVGIVMGAGLIWFGPRAWREGVVWVSWRVAPWVQAGEGRVVWEEGGVAYRNWALGKSFSNNQGMGMDVIEVQMMNEAIAVVQDVRVGSVDCRVLIGMAMSEQAGGTIRASMSVIDIKTRGQVWSVRYVDRRIANESGVGPPKEWMVPRPLDRIEAKRVPMNGKVWAGRVDPGDRNRFFVDYEWYGKRETFEVRVGVDAAGKPVVETKWLGRK